MAQPRTLVEKIWAAHVVAELGDATDLLHIDRVFLHERSGGRMLQGLTAAGRRVFDPSMALGTLDHIIDTDPGRTDKTKFPGGAEFIATFREGARDAGIRVFDIGDPAQGIVHVIAPELGAAQPGLTVVCGDSHTCTLGGVGALAWGIGVTQGEHALATQCLPAARPGQMRVRFEGQLADGVTAKDMVLHLIRTHGARGGDGCALEYAGAAVRGLSCAGRMTLCNMAVEFGAWTGIVAPDETTVAFLQGRAYAPKGAQWDQAAAWWRTLGSDDGARFDREIVIDAAALSPSVTWGTSSEQTVGVAEPVPLPGSFTDGAARASAEKALAYMGVAPGQTLKGLAIDAAFIGSCTNSRIEDLRAAAGVLAGRKVAPGVTAICVPGSTPVKRQAEAEGIDRVFTDAGFQWREAGCSLCFYNGGDSFGGARRVISSTNRNFENRQGPGVRTHLASPMTVAASAVAGAIADPREWLRR